ncbi:MAG: hypothetical protein O7E57_04585 [Gammaproteobacteria bacterium]|nr:hypothetical protein [Gammaproteobacteria bacterium]MCZ6855922.1 hypothetical protein [Gammaproteobacteria bacterium]
MAETKDLGMILDAKIPIIVIESPDERRVMALLLRFAIHRGLSFYEWSVTRGLHLGGFGTAPEKGGELTEPQELLQHIAARRGPALYALCDFHPYIVDEPKNVRYLKDIALEFENLENTVVLISHELQVPRDLGRLTASFDLRLPPAPKSKRPSCPPDTLPHRAATA